SEPARASAAHCLMVPAMSVVSVLVIDCTTMGALLPTNTPPTVNVGGVLVGSSAPIVVQSMTNTDTADIAGTIKQCAALARAGSELVRVTVNNDDAAKAVPHVVGIFCKEEMSVVVEVADDRRLQAQLR